MNRIQTAVVIGGTSGLGRSIAEALAAAGTKVTVFGRNLPEKCLVSFRNIRIEKL